MTCSPEVVARAGVHRVRAVPGSFFELVTRYSERPRRDPGENRLTAVFTAVLQARPSLARALLTCLLPRLVLNEDPAVDTQTTIRLADGRHAFLDMRIAASTPVPTTIWVEVKRTSGESGADQFEKYQRALELEAGQRVLRILAPSWMRAHLGALPRAGDWRPSVGASPHWLSWEEVYSALAGLGTDATHPWEAWAVPELLRYLEMESLDPIPVEHAHVAALANIAWATKAVATLIGNVERRAAIRMGEPRERTVTARDHYYELRYPVERVEPGGNWAPGVSIAWGVGRAEFFAGICTPGDSGPLRGMDDAGTEEWRAGFGNDDWRRMPGPEYWIWKVLPLDRIAEASGIEEQVDRALAFVQSTLDELIASRPAG
jgi:hypothetical protein